MASPVTSGSQHLLQRMYVCNSYNVFFLGRSCCCLSAGWLPPVWLVVVLVAVAGEKARKSDVVHGLARGLRKLHRPLLADRLLVWYSTDYYLYRVYQPYMHTKILYSCTQCCTSSYINIVQSTVPRYRYIFRAVRLCFRLLSVFFRLLMPPGKIQTLFLILSRQNFF